MTNINKEDLNKISGGDGTAWGFNEEKVSLLLEGEAKSWWDANYMTINQRALKAGRLFELMTTLYRVLYTEQQKPSLDEFKQIISDCGVDVSDL